MPLSQDLSTDVFGPAIVHRNVTVIEQAPLRVLTTPHQWAYAVTFPLRSDDSDAMASIREFGCRVVVDVSVGLGRIGVGVTNLAGDAFVVEKFTSDTHRQLSLLIPPRTPAGAVVLRNASETGASDFTIGSVQVESLKDTFHYPVQLPERDFAREAVPPAGDSATVFDTDAAYRINAARLDWLKESGLVKPGVRVLDAGAGIGHFLPYYLGLGCHVVAVEGRPENVALLKARHPTVDARVGDVQRLDPEPLGTFDLIHCFGLLYHLESPIAALRLFRQICVGRLILETMVCDSSRPVSVIADETKAASQALDGLGCRPSPAFLAVALNRVGFRYVYGASPPPRHEDFQFAWQDNLDTVRNGHPLRCAFVASDTPIDNSRLFPVVD
jgi:SAM-dependent methyltransferase